jgi:hypothetical protein
MKDEEIKKAMWVKSYQIALDRLMGSFGPALSDENPMRAHAALVNIQRQALSFANASVYDFERRFEENP